MATNSDYVGAEMQCFKSSAFVDTTPTSNYASVNVQPTMTLFRWGCMFCWLRCTWLWSPCCLGHCRGWALSGRNTQL